MEKDHVGPAFYEAEGARIEKQGKAGVIVERSVLFDHEQIDCHDTGRLEGILVEQQIDLV
jgi:hypothetical protein